MVGEESMKVRMVSVGSCGEREYESLPGSSKSEVSSKHQQGEALLDRDDRQDVLSRWGSSKLATIVTALNVSCLRILSSFISLVRFPSSSTP